MGGHEHGTTGHVLHWARAYDALVWALTLGNEGRFRQRLAELARLEAGQSVLDVGCGTGALAIAAKGFVGAGGEVAGVDPSPEMVARATRKAAKAGVQARFEEGTIEALPFPDATFDTVLSSLMLHHLTGDGLTQGLGEVARVLKAGGRFLAVDIGDTGGKGHHPFLRLGKHGDFDLDAQAPALEAAGLRIVDRGEVGQGFVRGMPSLRFILADTA
ncbi:MAG: methyltransferase domain-containing protein [Acidimicrobiales bacterium]|nr:methyltransferase domain-containing protein [Acidimicrobiales bacterium]